MKMYCRKISFILLIVIISSCKQNISLKETKLTEINPLSYTDVIHKSGRDTVLVSTFDGKIIQIIKDEKVNGQKVIIDINDEIYNIAYNRAENMIYVASLNSGIVIIDENKAKIEKTLPIGEKWCTSVSYNDENKILFASGYTSKPHLWNVDNNYTLINPPNEFSDMQPKEITNEGIVLFDGNGIIGLWDLNKKSVNKTAKLPGRISDLYSSDKVLSISDKKFILKNIKTDSVLFERTHPNWPIYVSSQDTTVKVPVSFALTDVVSTEKYIFSASIDKSIRKWDVENGELIDDLLGHRATISSLSVSEDENQLVSVDLKGNIKFWDLTKN